MAGNIGVRAGRSGGRGITRRETVSLDTGMTHDMGLRRRKTQLDEEMSVYECMHLVLKGSKVPSGVFRGPGLVLAI